MNMAEAHVWIINTEDRVSVNSEDHDECLMSTLAC